MPGAALFGFIRKITHDVLDWHAAPLRQPVDHAGQFRRGLPVALPARNNSADVTVARRHDASPNLGMVEQAGYLVAQQPIQIQAPGIAPVHTSTLKEFTMKRSTALILVAALSVVV